MAGRRQNLKSTHIRLLKQPEISSNLDVYWSLPPIRDEFEERSLMPGDLPLMAAREPLEFASVLENWLRRHADWKEARLRFSTGFSSGNTYSIDRLIGSANMFDILPNSALPAAPVLTAELENARKSARTLFRALPDSEERGAVLGALGRLGENSLRRKIKYRATFVFSVFGEKLHDLSQMIDLAVDCRNHFVHGSNPKINYTENYFDTVPFVTNTLEFVFAASDLIENGWNGAKWRERGSTMSHPFGAYIVNYDLYRKNILRLIQESKTGS